MKGSPKIHNKSVPEAESEGKKAEVEEHNREFEKGHDRAAKAEDDKVDKKFWSGEFLFDRLEGRICANAIFRRWCRWG